MLLNLPLEILKEVLNHLDFNSIEPFLTAFPCLKRHTLIVRDARQEDDPIFNIAGVQVINTLPRVLRELPQLRGHQPILILCELTERDLNNSRIPGKHELKREHCEALSFFTLSIFERLKRSNAAIFIHASPGAKTMYPPKYTTAKMELIRKGVNFKESMESRLFEMDMSVMFSEELVGSTFRVMDGLHSLKITSRHRYDGIDFRSVKKLSIEFPRCPVGVDQCFVDIKAHGLRELNIKYRSVLPLIDNVNTFLEDHEDASCTHFSIVDLDTESWNVLPPRYRQEDFKDPSTVVALPRLSFTARAHSIHISGPHTNHILWALLFNRCESLSVVERSGSQLRPIMSIRSAYLKFFRWQTDVRGSRVPQVISRTGTRLQVYLFSRAPQLRYKGLLSGLGCTITDLSIQKKLGGGVESHQISASAIEKSAATLRSLNLCGVPAPFLGDERLEFPELRSVVLSDILNPSLDVSTPLEIRCFAHSDSIHSLSISRTDSTAYNSIKYVCDPGVRGPRMYSFSGLTGTFEISRRPTVDFLVDSLSHMMLSGDEGDKVEMFPAVDV